MNSKLTGEGAEEEAVPKVWESERVKQLLSDCKVLRHCFKYRRSLSEWDSNVRGRKFAAA